MKRYKNDTPLRSICMSDDIIFSPTFFGGEFDGRMYSGDQNVRDDSDILYLTPILWNMKLKWTRFGQAELQRRSEVALHWCWSQRPLFKTVFQHCEIREQLFIFIQMFYSRVCDDRTRYFKPKVST